MKKEREIVELTLALEDDILTAEQGARLAELLDGDKEAQLLYVQARHMAIELESRLSANANIQSVPAVAAPQPRQTRWLGWAAAALLLLGIVFGALTKKSSPPLNTNSAAYPHGLYVAAITESVDAEWTHDSGDVGPSLPPGKLSLSSGWLQLEFTSSAKLVVEAPAELVLTDADRAELVEGGVRVEIPKQAKGFVLGLPNAEVVDLGTGFAVSVKKGVARLQVIKGVVELRQPGQAAIRLSKGDGAEVARNGQVVRADIDLRALLGTREVARMAAEQDRRRYARWQKSRDQRRNDSDLIFYYDFEPRQEDQRTLQQIAHRPEGQRADGAIVGAQWSRGRWKNKGALDFKQINDRVRINIPDQLDRITLAAWIRMDGFDRPFNSLLLSSHWDLHDIHWQVKRSGALELAHQSGNGGTQLTTGRVLTQANLGSWVHLAVTYDTTRAEMVHYFNGKEVDRRRFKPSPSVIIGIADIGNWAPHRSENPNLRLRNFNGRMDEMLAYKRVLSDKEVMALYLSGKP